MKKAIFLAIICVIILNNPALTAGESPANVILADFENGIPCSECGDLIGFRKKDVENSTVVPDGADGSKYCMETTLVYPNPRDVFLQGNVRRMYLATGSSTYDPNGPNTLSFWVKIPTDSSLFGSKDGFRLDVLTYHWRPGDMAVGGTDNNSFATDSFMHGYSYLFIDKKSRGKWINIVLSPSAFFLSRDYLHFYSAQATTDELGFFPSLRLLQLRVWAETEKNETIQYDQIKLAYKQPTATFKESYYEATKKCTSGPLKVPVIIINPTEKDRKYRVFISSHIGINRKTYQEAFSLADNIAVWDNLLNLRAMMIDSESDGGVGAADLLDSNGTSVIKMKQEIFIPAKGAWKGELVHYIRPEMLGKAQAINIKDTSFSYTRNTLLTSVIVWDPYDTNRYSAKYVTLNRPESYADVENRNPLPPGFPRQKRPPVGWQSKDIPFDQVGGYFVSAIRLTGK